MHKIFFKKYDMDAKDYLFVEVSLCVFRVYKYSCKYDSNKQSFVK